MQLIGNEIHFGGDTKLTFDGDFFYIWAFLNGEWSLVDQEHVSEFHRKWQSKLVIDHKLGAEYDDKK